MNDIAVSLVAMATLAAFIWAVYGHFQSRQLPPGARIVSLFALGSGVVMMVLLWLFPQPIPATTTGIVTMLLAKALFWSAICETRSAKLLAAFTSESPHGLVRTGPYKLVRHPFYTSYLLYWAGFAIATWSVWSLPLLVGLTVMYWRAAVDEEDKFANTDMSVAYADYKQSTGRFFPRVFRAKP